jgi:SAM-dependent methyltransferase
MNNNKKLTLCVNSFQNLWHGGFRTGYSEKRNQRGLEEYILPEVTNKCVLEIGCGGGQWSKTMYERVDKLYCIDVLSSSHNQFWSYVGEDKRDKIRYCHVKDFSLSDIPDNSIDYVFSYDVFCHIPLSGHKEYLKNLHSKCKKGAKLCIMYADPEKYLLSESENLFHLKEYIPNKGENCKSVQELIDACLIDEDGEPSEGRWFWIGIDKFVSLCKEYGYTIINEDLNIDKTNPITLFRK